MKETQDTTPSAVFYGFTPKSGNSKTGPIPVTWSQQSTCPDACPLKARGCYAKSGPILFAWYRLNRQGLTFDELVAKIAGLPEGTLWRHNQAGDLPGENNSIDHGQLSALVRANTGKRGFTYTHKPMHKANAASVRAANRAGFTINLSADNPVEADMLSEQDCGPVVCVLPADAPDTTYTPAGRKVIVCPAQRRDDLTCAQCGLCQHAKRSVIVGFRAHGNQAKAASAIAKGGQS